MPTKSSFARTAALLGMTVTCLDVLMMVFMGASLPGYDPMRQYISELGSSINPYARILNVWWMIYSLPMVIFAAGLYSVIRKYKYGWLAPLLFFLDFVGNGVLTGLFSCDVGCRGTSFSNMAHIFVSAVGSVAATLVPFGLYLAIRKEKKWKGFRRTTLIMGAALACSLMLMGLAEGAPALVAYKGLIQRINTLVYYSYIFLLAKQILLHVREKK